MPGARKYFEDVDVGMHWERTAPPFTRERIVSFAREFDPVPMHIDEAAARASYFRGLIASGAHLFAVWRRVNFDIYADLNLAIIAGAGFDALRLRHPVRAGDVLTLRSEIAEKVPLANKADHGLLHSQETMTNQDGAVVMTMRASCFVLRRPQSP
ncbi:MAG: MaoC family dehydratase N-terminal domain-containing protein [Candidatus Lambdaproteobacteria bacterium]|nr:MaoC family dehydratase N-terminal domain-containing protein [Candidatus Lambdaproteobacteria bacterium]